MTKVWQRHIEEIPTQKTAFRGKDMWQDFWRRPLDLCPVGIAEVFLTPL